MEVRNLELLLEDWIGKSQEVVSEPLTLWPPSAAYPGIESLLDGKCSGQDYKSVPK